MIVNVKQLVWPYYTWRILQKAILKVVLQKHFDSITNDDELIDLVEATTKMIEGGKERVEEHIEEALLLSQFIINNTIAVQEWNTSETALP